MDRRRDQAAAAECDRDADMDRRSGSERAIAIEAIEFGELGERSRQRLDVERARKKPHRGRLARVGLGEPR